MLSIGLRVELPVLPGQAGKELMRLAGFKDDCSTQIEKRLEN